MSVVVQGRLNLCRMQTISLSLSLSLSPPPPPFPTVSRDGMVAAGLRTRVKVLEREVQESGRQVRVHTDPCLCLSLLLTRTGLPSGPRFVTPRKSQPKDGQDAFGHIDPPTHPPSTPPLLGRAVVHTCSVSSVPFSPSPPPPQLPPFPSLISLSLDCSTSGQYLTAASEIPGPESFHRPFLFLR